MRFRLHTLLIAMAVVHPVLGSIWWAYKVDDELAGTAGAIVVLVVGFWLTAKVLAYLP